MNRTIVVIPTLNEYENVKILLSKFVDVDVDVIFIDDNSTDLTDQIIKNNINFEKKYFLITRSSKKGYASACIAGIDFGIKNNYKSIVQMDADLSHSIEDLLNLLKFRKKSDVVIGSRYVKGGMIVGWGPFRKYLSYFANLTCRKLLKVNISDFTSGFRVYDSKIFSEIILKKISAEGYSFLVEVIYKIHLKSFTITEVPIIFNDRKYGNSKLDKRVILDSIINLIRISTKGVN